MSETHQMTPLIRSPRRLGLRLGCAALLAAAITAAALAIGPPPAMATDVTGHIPGSDRAFELVSPASAGGPVQTRPPYFYDNGGLGFSLDATGNLFPQLVSPLDVKGGGSVVFWESQATPPGTGAVQDGQSLDTFRSIRTASGWSTEDLTPFTGPSGTQLDKQLVGASADGTTALVATSLALTPGAFADPQQAIADPSLAEYLYRVSADGRPPQMVSVSEPLIPDKDSLAPFGSNSGDGMFRALSASANLNEVAFTSTFGLEGADTCTNGTSVGGGHSAYLWNANVGLAHPLVNFNQGPCTAPNVNDVQAILPDGSLILQPNPANPLNGYAVGPLVEHNPSLINPGAVTGLAGVSSGGTFLSVTPDGSTAYVLENQALVAQDASGGGQIYAISTQTGVPESGLPLPSDTSSVTCVSCASDQTNVAYVGASADGAHVLFTTDQGLWEWDASAGAQLLTPTPVTDLAPQTVAVSENGQYVVGLTTQLAGNPNGTADLYEFSAGRPPTLLTSGTTADSYALSTTANGSTYVAGGVSDDGSRIVYNDSPASGGPERIEESVAGQTHQISPPNSQFAYSVAAISGADLQDVFFLANDPLIPQDANAGASDVYDARVGGGFPYTPPAFCDPLADACQGTPTGAPMPPTAGTVTFAGPGNVPATTPSAAAKVKLVRETVVGSTFSLTINAPADGRITITGAGIRTIRRSLARAGTVTLRVTLTPKAKATIGRRHRLKVNVRIGYTPASGQSSSATVSLTLKQPKKRARGARTAHHSRGGAR